MMNQRTLSPRLASSFLTTGLIIVLLEGLLFPGLQATTIPFSTRSLIGYHLFPSEIWFLVFGNVLLLVAIATGTFSFHRSALRTTVPVVVFFSAYLLWLLFGLVRQNVWAIEEFREMALSIFAFPIIIYLSSIGFTMRAFHRFVNLSIILVIVKIILDIIILRQRFYVHNAFLMILTLPLAFYVILLQRKAAKSLFPLLILIAPFLLKFSKPMLPLLAVAIVIAAFFSVKEKIGRASCRERV